MQDNINGMIKDMKELVTRMNEHFDREIKLT